MRKEFLYWYPLDLRNSGKDLVGNHLTFSIFNHVALFPKEHWPRSYGVNGWITISGSKMSKSAGNALTLDSALEMFGADVTRITEAYADEGFNDPNWDQDFAESAGRRLMQLLENARSLSDLGKHREDQIDRWMKSTVNSLYISYADAMDNMMYKPAVKACLIDMQNALRWYTRRKEGRLNRSVMDYFVVMQILMLSPFAPHVCEEAWEISGHSGSVCVQRLPDRNATVVDETALKAERYLEGVMSDVQEILSVTGIKPKTIRLIVAEEWKRRLLDIERRNNREEASAFRKSIPETEKAGLEQLLRNIARERQQGRLQSIADMALAIDEFACLKENSAFLSREFGCTVLAVRAEELRDDEAGGRKGSSFPTKPAIFIE
jgi:leucyl-tRNA synthetase